MWIIIIGYLAFTWQLHMYWIKFSLSFHLHILENEFDVNGTYGIKYCIIGFKDFFKIKNFKFRNKLSIIINCQLVESSRCLNPYIYGEKRVVEKESYCQSCFYLPIFFQFKRLTVILQDFLIEYIISNV